MTWIITRTDKKGKKWYWCKLRPCNGFQYWWKNNRGKAFKFYKRTVLNNAIEKIELYGYNDDDKLIIEEIF